MKKNKFIKIFIILLIFLNMIEVHSEEKNNKLNILSDNIKLIEINSMSPLQSDLEMYQYQTYNSNEIKFIVHLLNSFEVEKQSDSLWGSDSRYFIISITDNDNNKNKLFLLPNDVGGRLNTDYSTQYMIMNDGVNQFLDYINALKSKKLILPDKISFEMSEWAKDDIERALQSELVPKWNQINYTEKINRLEICQITDRFLDINGVEVSRNQNYPFKDTNNISVENLYSLGIIDGKTENEFYPYDYITREETAKILSKLCDIMQVKGVDTNHIYTDQDDISQWAVDFVNKTTDLKLFNGDEKNRFNPKNCITKEEFVVTLLRLADDINK